MIRQAISRWAARTPDRTAMIYNEQVWSYRRFDRAIASVERVLEALECRGPGVAVIATNILSRFWCASLALRSRGLTTIALPSTDALGKLDLPDVVCVVAWAGATWDGLKDRCSQAQIPLLHVSWDGDPEGSPSHVAATPGGHILLTSGTTGVAKKVLIDPSFEIDFLHHRQALLGLDETSVCNVFDFPPWTGACYKLTVGTWLAGGSVIIQQGGEVYRALLNTNQTHAVVTPIKLTAILEAPVSAFPFNERLQLSVSGGSPYRAQIELAKQRIAPHIYNRLGATETCTFGFTRLDHPEDYRWHAPVPGRAVEVVGQDGKPVPDGQSGFLRVSTADGPTGYLADERSTATFFKAGFFYTGDLAVLRADGRFALQGRATDVINLGGTKVPPSTIEDKLIERFGLKGVCVLSYPNQSGEEGLLVVIEGDANADPAAVETHLRQEAGGLTWIRIHHRETLPRNVMGKLMRRTVQDDLKASGDIV